MSSPVGSSPSPLSLPAGTWIDAFSKEWTEQLDDDARFAAWPAGGSDGFAPGTPETSELRLDSNCDVDSGPAGNTQSQIVAQSIAELFRDDTVLRGLHRIAERHGWLPRGSDQASDLVADVILGVVEGRIARDERPLRAQVRREVRRHAKAHQRAAERSVLLSLDDAPGDALVDTSTDVERAEASAPTRDSVEVVRVILELAAADPPVLQIVDLDTGRLLRRRDARGAGMTPKLYRTARERLAKYAAEAVAVTLAVQARSSSDG